MENNSLLKYKRIHIAQSGGAPIIGLWEAGAEVIKNVGDATKKYESNNKGESALTKDDKSAEDIAIANKKARALFESKGLGHRYDEFSRKLNAFEGDDSKQKIVLNSEIPQFLNVVSRAASQSLAPIDSIFDIASKIYYATPSLDLVEQTLSTISKYEKLMPGISFWEDALKASNGEEYENLFNLKKMAIMGIGKADSFGDFEDLDTVVGFANTPGSKFDQRMMQKMRSDKARQRSTEESGLMNVQLKALYKKKQNEAVQKINKFYQDNFRKITDNKMFDLWMRILYGIGSLSSGKNLFNSLLAPAESQGLLPGTPSSARGSFNQHKLVRLSQSPQDIRPSPNTTPGTPGASTSGSPSASNVTTVNSVDDILQKIDSWNELITTESDFNIIKKQFDELMNTIYQSQSQTANSLAGQALGSASAAPMANPQQIAGLSSEAKQMITQLFEKASQILQIIDRVQSDPAIIAEAGKNAKVAARIKNSFMGKTKYINVQEELRGNLITLEENINMAPLLIEINALSIVEQEYKASYTQALSVSPIGAMPAAQSYASILMQLYQLLIQATQKYVDMASSATMPQMKQVFALRARQFMASAMQKAADASDVMNNASAGIFGKSAGTAPYLFRKTAEQVSEEQEREADARIREYLDDLYEKTPGSPNVGTLLDNPARYRGVLTTDVGKMNKYRRHKKRPADKKA